MRLNRLRATAAEICPGTSRKFNTQVSSKSHSCYAPRRISPPSAAATRQFYQNKIITFRFEERSSRKRVRHRWQRQRGKRGRKNTFTIVIKASFSYHLDYSLYIVFIFVTSRSILPFNLNYTLMKSFD